MRAGLSEWCSFTTERYQCRLPANHLGGHILERFLRDPYPEDCHRHDPCGVCYRCVGAEKEERDAPILNDRSRTGNA